MDGSPEGIPTDNQKRGGASSSRAMDELFKFDGPPEQFLSKLLATQCRRVKADSAVLIRPGEGNQPELLSTCPRVDAGGTSLDWIDKAEAPFRRAMNSGEAVIVKEDSTSKDNGKPQSYLIALPLENEGVFRAAAVFRVRSRTPQKLLLCHARLEATSLLLNHHERGLMMTVQQEGMHRLRGVLEVLDVVNRPKRFLGAAMALCNEIAARLGCRRVSLGILDGRCVQVRAVSHTDTFSREMRVVQAIEAAMEECLDQDLEIIYPAADAAIYTSRAVKRLSERHGPSVVLSLPMRDDGEVCAVMTLERPPGKPFDKLDEIETVRLICDLCAPRILDLKESDRWMGARLASWGRQHVGLLLGHEYTWIKIGAALVFFMAVLLATVKGDYRVDTAFALEARNQQVVVAPFDTFSKSVLVEPGDRVEAGKTILGTLETAELRLKLAALKAEQLGYQKQMTASMRDRKTAEAQIAQAQSDKVAAQIRMIEKKIEQAGPGGADQRAG
jgi:hypothetical protein